MSRDKCENEYISQAGNRQFELFKKELRNYPKYTSLDGKVYDICDGVNLAQTASGLLRDASLPTSKLNSNEDETRKHRNAETILIHYIAARAYMFIHMRHHAEYQNDENAVVNKVCIETLDYVKKHHGIMGHKLSAHIGTLVKSRCIDQHRQSTRPEPHIGFGDIDIAITNGLQDIVELNNFFSDAVATLRSKDRLSQDQADIICYQYGLGDYEHIEGLKKIAKKMGMCPDTRVYPLNKSAMKIFSEYCYKYKKELQCYFNSLNPEIAISFSVKKNENE